MRMPPPEIDLQVIVVDNGSTEACDKSFSELFPDIVYVKSEVNLGFARGNNLGLRYATKSHVLLLNSDTLITSRDTFRKSIQIVQEYNDRIVLTTRLLTEDGKPQAAYGYLPGPWLEFMLTLFLHKLLPKQKRNELLIRFVPGESRLIRSGYITATYYLFNRNLLGQLPGGKLYDQTFLYGEELFWAHHWESIGVQMYYAANLSIIHFVGESSKVDKNHNTRARRAYQIAAEHDYLVWRYPSFIVFMIYCLRLLRFSFLALFDKDIRLRLVILLKLIFAKPGKHG